jgi:hypothetical protein
MAFDRPGNVGTDIRSVAPPDGNVFTGNVCLTSLNAPCPALAASLIASPNPVPVTAASPLGITTISWMVSSTDSVEVRIGSPDGTLLAGGGARGSAITGAWVSDGMTFYLQDVGGGKPLTADNTLAIVVVRLQRK